jgi:16S rRNA (cytosine967-C5)-methyltransferase
MQLTVSPSRAAAFDILVRVEREDSYAIELLHSRAVDRLSPQDRGLAMELVMGVLRWRSRLDAAIAQYSFTPFPRLDFEVLTALRIGAYQLEFLTGIPNRAAVNESVNLAKRAKKKSAAAMVNVILRKIAASVAQRRARLAELEPERESQSTRSTGPLVNRALPGETAPQFLARQYAHPEWIVERWVREYGVQAASQICAYNQTVPVTAIRLRSNSFGSNSPVLAADPSSDDSASFASSASSSPPNGSEPLELAPGKLISSARLVINGDVTHSAACLSGEIAIQDEGSQLIAALVGEGERILDCCAAPGGKTSAIADRNPQAKIVAADLHAHRTRLMRQLVTQPNVEIITADAAALPVSGTFDRVLADVPCSGTGTLARNPEIRWRLKTADLADLQQRQVTILNASLQRLAPGGRLIYSTCSLEPEENEQVVEQILRERSDFRLVDMIGELEKLQARGILAWPDLHSLTRRAYLRTIPGQHPCDGFFAAILEKVTH